MQPKQQVSEHIRQVFYDTDLQGSHEGYELNAEDINAALDNFWRNRAANGPTHQTIRQHLTEEAEYLKDIGSGKNR